jgi:hypothetical protein
MPGTCESASLSLSLRGHRLLFLSKLAPFPRQCGKHRHNSLIVRAYQLDMRIVGAQTFFELLPHPHAALPSCGADKPPVKQSSRSARLCR